MGKRKNIALFVAMIENDFSYAVCEGALMGAAEIDANLYILPAGIIDAKYDDYDANCYRYQYNTLYSFVNSKAFDAVILERLPPLWMPSRNGIFWRRLWMFRLSCSQDRRKDIPAYA